MSAKLRPVLISIVLMVACLFVFTWGITLGDYPLTFWDVWRILTGNGTRIENRIVIDVRLGRQLVGLLVGAALGFSGALTQSVSRNPLASPDVLGITQGASLAAVTLLTFAGTAGLAGDKAQSILSIVGLPVAAIIGALVVALVVWVIAGKTRSSIVHFVLIGVAISTLCSSLTTWVMAIGNLDQVAGARLWLTGSLNGRDFDNVWMPLVVLVLALTLAAYLAFQLEALTLGDQLATVLGHNVRLAQGIQLVVAVLLAAVAVSAAGPIGFVAFVAPQIAMKIAGSPTPPLVTSAWTGALIVLAADLGTRALLPWELPVGILTTILGAPVLIYLIINANRKASR